MRFHDLFAAIAKIDFSDNSCFVSGVRAEEAPKRLMSLTHKATYKWITWGKILSKSKNQISFYPIYDWLYSDIWKAIHDHSWTYNRVYDQFYRYGASIPQMRVSNLHHETALHHIMQVQDIEPETWTRLQGKISGANTIKHLKDMAYECPKDLPYMFESWKEYAYYLTDNLIENESNKQKIHDYIKKCDGLYDNSLIEKTFYRTIINTVLSSDWDLTKISNFEIRQETNAYRQFKKGVYKSAMIPYVKYLTQEEQQILQKEVKKQYDQSQ
jgi:predicted phosphoadenosine phosphosulfate sulfurtransferase